MRHLNLVFQLRILSSIALNARICSRRKLANILKKYFNLWNFFLIFGYTIKIKNMENTQETVKTPEQIELEEKIDKEFRELMEEYTK